MATVAESAGRPEMGRCKVAGCTSLAREAKTGCCKAHGGGKRCSFVGCGKSAEGKTD